MPASTHRLAAVLATATLVSLTAPLALASQPSAVYTVPRQLDFFPDEANATRVVIHGAFFFYQSGGSYGAPGCGYMHYACPAGSEKMCRMQWADIKASIGQAQCVGFGPQSMVPKATLYSEGTPLGTADAWDLGIGVTPGTYVGGQCAPAQALKCLTGGDVDMATPTADMATPTDPPGPGPGPGGGSGGGACAMTAPTGGAVSALSAGLALLGAAAAALRLRRRRQR